MSAAANIVPHESARNWAFLWNSLKYFEYLWKKCLVTLIKHIREHYELKNYRSTTLLNDAHREKALSNKTSALSKSMSMDIWVVGTLNQLFIKIPFTETKFLKR